MRLRRDLTLIAALLAVTLLGGAQAQAARDPVTAPTLLWKTYPLVQDPFSPRYGIHVTADGGFARPLPARMPEDGSGLTPQMLLLLMLTTLVAGAAGLLLLRSEFAGAGYPRSSRRKRRTPRPAGQRMLSQYPRPLDHPVGRPVTRQRRRKSAAERGVPRCEIGLWHGYVKYQLYASSEGAGACVALSDFFHLRDEDAPTRNALAELETLVTRLEARGWAVVDDGPRWFDVQFERADD
jgi:hypothetical protein